MGKIIDHRQAEEAYQAWRKEHPEEAAESDRQWQEFQKDPLKFIAFMESKGFHFSDYDRQAVARRQYQRLPWDQKLRKRWQHYVDWWKGLPKVQRGYLVSVAFFLGLGVFVMLLGVFSFRQILPLIKEINFADPNVLKQTYQIAWVAGISCVLLACLFAGLCLWLQSLLHYAFYLESRIRVLEQEGEKETDEQ